MNCYDLSLSGLMWRYYLMMAVILIGGFTGMWWLALLGLPIFITAICGIRLSGKRNGQPAATTRSLPVSDPLRKTG